MYNLYEGNSGRVKRMEEPARQQNMPPAVTAAQSVHPAGHSRGAFPSRLPSFTDRLTEILPRALGSLENEDILLILILYLMYKESGDEELLMILGGMFI